MFTRAPTFPADPLPTQGVGEFGRPRRAWTSEIAGSNPAALTTTRTTAGG